MLLVQCKNLDRSHLLPENTFMQFAKKSIVILKIWPLVLPQSVMRPFQRLSRKESKWQFMDGGLFSKNKNNTAFKLPWSISAER